MPWRFVGRAEQIGRVRCALESLAPGPIVITGEPGMGRTALLARALGEVDHGRYEVVRVQPTGTAPLASLRACFPGCLARRAAPSEAADALARHAGGRRLVVVADDAHLMDDASMLALRELSRSGDAMLVVSHLIPAEPPLRPDPTYCLEYERDVQTIVLPPLTAAEVADLVGGLAGGSARPAAAAALHAATGGNPRLLHDLLVVDGLATQMAARDGVWDLDAVPARAGDGVAPASVIRLAEAASRAWQQLAIEQVEQLCRLALWCGADDKIASIWPLLLLLRGSPDEAMDFLDSLDDSVTTGMPQIALIRAMILAFGFGRTEWAAQSLLAAASRGVGSPGLLLAYRAWLLAVTGQGREAAAALSMIERGDQETALFVNAARAAVTRLDGHAGEAVFHFRRAVATAGNCGDSWPWMLPYLSACLCEALMVAGRVSEVCSATGMQVEETGTSRDVAGAFGALIAGRGPYLNRELVQPAGS